MIMSDWTGVYSTEESIKAGLDLEMPYVLALFCNGQITKMDAVAQLLCEDPPSSGL